MRRSLRIAGIFLVALLLVVQFFRPDRNNSQVDPVVDMIAVVQPPDQVANILRVACYDCHSNRTRYPWYDKVQPVSWFLNNHILEGKKHLNFSMYGDLEKVDRISLLVKTCEVVEAGKMPLQSYKWRHKEARLSQEEIALLCKWTEEEALRVMRE